MSVQTKINLALVLVLVAIMSASLFIAASTEKRLVLQVVEQQTRMQPTRTSTASTP